MVLKSLCGRSGASGDVSRCWLWSGGVVSCCLVVLSGVGAVAVCVALCGCLWSLVVSGVALVSLALWVFWCAVWWSLLWWSGAVSSGGVSGLVFWYLV